jgi:hypothetical protein
VLQLLRTTILTPRAIRVQELRDQRVILKRVDPTGICSLTRKRLRELRLARSRRLLCEVKRGPLNLDKFLRYERGLLNNQNALWPLGIEIDLSSGAVAPSAGLGVKINLARAR